MLASSPLILKALSPSWLFPTLVCCDIRMSKTVKQVDERMEREREYKREREMIVLVMVKLRENDTRDTQRRGQRQ